MFARIAILLTVVAIVCALGMIAWAADNGSADEPVCYNHGDVNGDGVIDNRDAIYTLYHFMYGGEQYPVDQDWDFNNDGKHSNQDAIYVLYASMFEEDPDYQLKGFIHNYHAPTWEWSEHEEADAQVSFKCACGEEHVFVTEEGGVTVEKTVTQEATCLKEGAVTYVASIEFEGKEYTNTKTVRTAMLKHSLEGFQTCEEGTKCKNCDYTLPALGHNWEEKSRTEASCSSRAVITYACSNCRVTRNEETGEYADHVMAYMDGCDVQDGCKYTRQYKCKNCPLTTDGTVYYQHNYVAQITPATCVADGSKTYVCDKCQEPEKDGNGNAKVEVLHNADAHNWVETAEAGVFACSNDGCTKTKKTVVAVDTAVNKDDLAEADEMKLSNDGAAMAVDSETLEKLNVQQTIQVTVTPVPVEDTALSAEQQAQIPSGTVYNFEMKVDNATVAEFDTPITISLPYTPEEGEDLDAIDVWYIDDEGNAQSFKGTYSNGFVTFTTTHFSYYTVTRMTPAERCARYGHIYVTTHKDPTCTEDGYDLVQCQRCAAKESDTKLEKIGHDYKATTVDATCTTDGSVTRICQNEGCKHYLIEKLPALGHKMEKDEELSVEATCQAPGKEVTACTRAGCNEKTETAVAQLPHTFETEETDPDCVNKGHKKVYCKVCKTVDSAVEKAPTGHNYLPENAVWKWSEDYKSATVVLICSYDKSHTKELTAVVSSETKTETTCLGSGAIVYTAVASFNKAEFRNSVTVTQGAAGHKPGSSWSMDETKHWHVCSACAEHVDAAFHSWDEGKVVTAPTCAEAGETLYTCTICGYEKTVTVKATGAHNYHYGVCKVCGFGKSTCSHEAIHTIEADMSQYGICEGAVFFWITCDCGQNKTLVGDTIECNLGEPVIKKATDEYGIEYNVEVYTCPDCGLIGETATYIGINDEECAYAMLDVLRIIKNGEVLIDDISRQPISTMQHPAVIVTKEIDMSQYGLCGVILQEMICPCGQGGGVQTKLVKDGCQFEYIDGIETCTVCGAQIKYSRETEQNGCTYIQNYTCSVYMDEEVVYNYQYTVPRDEHIMLMKDYSLTGDSCEDGLIITYECVKCGKTETEKEHYHAEVVTTSIDLNGSGICSGNAKLIQSVCPCGARKSAYLETTDYETSCNWMYEDLDGDEYPEYRKCEVCGTTQNITITYGVKGEWCQCVAYETITYKDKDGNKLAVGYSIRDTQHHDVSRTATLKGESCEEGVVIVDTCADCDYRDEWEVEWHYNEVKATFDLSSFDMCSTKGELRSCLCGEEEWFNFVGGYCEWQWVDGGNNWHMQKCDVCGVEMKESYKNGVSPDECHTLRYTTLEFFRDGVSLGKFSFEQMAANHAFVVNEVEFMDESAGCAGGVRGSAECVICGEKTQFEARDVEHAAFATEIEILCTEGLCGKLIWAKYSCVCGEEQWENTEWLGGYCEYNGGYYSEELDCYVQVCSQCGAERASEGQENRVEGTTCTVQRNEHVVFYRNGEVLCEYEAMHTYESHTNVHTYEMLGDTCDDGYYITRTCALCGYSYRDEGLYYGCDRRATDIVIVCDNENICGPIYAEQISCACGKNKTAYVSSHCRFEWASYDSETGLEKYRCQNCGLERIGNERWEKIPGSCDAQRIFDYTYLLNGEVIGTITRGYDVKYHNSRYSFTMLGESCEEGFYVHEWCANCDYSFSEDYLHMGHEWFELECYDLSEYGMCDGGEVRLTGCACGKTRECYEYTACDWQHIGFDSDTGLEERYCADCDTYTYTGTLGEIDETTCQFNGVRVFRAVRNGEVLLDVTGPTQEYRHNYQLAGANFDADKNCQNGVTILRQCKACGDMSEDHIYYHEHFTADDIDLAAAGFACGGELRIGGCACGQENYFHEGFNCSNMNWNDRTETGSDGIERYIIERECSDCGLKYIRSWYNQQIEGCRYKRYETIEVYQNGSVIKTMERQYPEYQHSYEIFSSALSEGSVTCEDGVDLIWLCRDCGETTTGWTYNHSVTETDTVIDLTPYGSICGAELRLYQCACGKHQEYRFSENSKCDVTYYRDTLWITDAINGDQSNVDGHVWLESYAEKLGCGVTNPDPCGLELFRATYWLVEDCIATQYVTWRMGYDEATDTWDQEFTVATGEQRAWHAYQETHNDQRVDGTGTHMWREECADCGSYHEVVETWQNHNVVKRTEDYYNTLNFGQNRRHQITDENAMVVQSKVNPNESFWMPTKSEHTWTRMNGDVHTEGWTRVYDFSGDCMATTSYWNTDGHKWTDTAPAHTIFMEWEVGTQSTCTQVGEWVRPCRICGKITEDERQPMDPTMHNFVWDEDLLKYVCSVCELESVRPYSGSIAMEDLTEDTGADYVIGYYNRDEIEVMPKVSVMLYDVSADELDELVLVGIEFTYYTVDNDGFTGLSFNKAAAQAAADQAIAEAGYSGSYGIRISFVPVDTQHELDYAITFETQTTAE